MFLILWEFEVKPGGEERFEDAYGPGGAWTLLFGRASDYRETRLLCDPSRERTYLTADFWESREAYESFKLRHHDTYVSLDEACASLTARERCIGFFDQIC